jgi:Zn-dependent protease
VRSTDVKAPHCFDTPPGQGYLHPVASLRVRIPLRPAPLAQQLLLLAPVLLFSIIAHEIAHGYAALTQGDSTAYKLGRLSWNPIKHIDPWMSIVLPLMLMAVHAPVLAGAKPVPVDPRNYRNYRRGDIIVSLAGIAANLVIAVGCTLVTALLGVIGRAVPAVEPVFGILQAMAVVGIGLNLILAAFNLFPIPPLDGSHVVKYLLPPAWALRYQQIGFFGLLLLILLLNTPVLRAWLRPAYAAAAFLMSSVQSLLLPSAEHWLRGVLL